MTASIKRQTKTSVKAKTSEKPEKCGPSFAIDPLNGNRKVSVANAIKDREPDYICPHCGAAVYKKAGPVRRHHFSHYPGADCQFDRESDLHFGAKLYLCEKLLDNAPLEIEVSFDTIPESNLKAILKRTGASSFKIPIARFFDNLLAEHQVEKYIENFAPDVLSTHCGEPVMAWEICVKNPMPDEKVAFYEERKIPYIELTPCEHGKEDFLFTVRRPGNVRLYSPESFTIAHLKDIFLDELQTDIASDVIRYFLDHYQELINKKLFGDLDLLAQARIPVPDSFLNFEQPFDVLRDFMKNSGRLEILQNIHKHVTGEQKSVTRLTDIDLVESKHNFVVELNGMYMDSSLNLCGEFFRQFSGRFPIMASLNQDNEILDMKAAFVLRSLQPHEFVVENYSEVLPTSWINLSLLSYDYDENDKPCYKILPHPDMTPEEADDIQPAILADPAHACYRFLKRLQDVCEIRLISGKGNDGIDYVFGIQIDGLYNANEFNGKIKDSLMAGFKEILFSDPLKVARARRRGSNP